jgi:hypothetical protein
MPATPKWMPNIKRRSSLASISEDNTKKGNASDTASTNGSINSTVSTSTPNKRPIWRRKTTTSPPDELGTKPLQKKIWERRKRPKDENGAAEDQPKLKEENKAMALDLEAARNTLSIRDQELEQSKTRIKLLEEKQESLTRDLENANSEAELTMRELEEWKARSAEMEGRYEALTIEVKSGNGGAVIQRQEFEELRQKFRSLSKGMDDFQGEAVMQEQDWRVYAAQMQADNELLKNSVDILEKEIGGMKAKLRGTVFCPAIKWWTGVKF